MGAHAAYLKTTTKQLVQGGAVYVDGDGARSAYFFKFEDDEEPTAVHSLETSGVKERANEENGVLYDLHGQRIERPTQSGIYILNGKKIYIK